MDTAEFLVRRRGSSNKPARRFQRGVNASQRRPSLADREGYLLYQVKTVGVLEEISMAEALGIAFFHTSPEVVTRHQRPSGYVLFPAGTVRV